MSWMEKLTETYDACSELVGLEVGNMPVLLPIAHSTANAQIEMVIDMQGNLVKELTCVLDKDSADRITVIPVTEDSGARGNGTAPHPLHDKLCYIAGDYSRYTGDNKKQDYYKAYLKGLSAWAGSEHSHPCLTAVYTYVSKGTVIKDLVDIGILKLTEDGVLSDKEQKIHGLPQSGAFVRFAVEDSGEIIRPWKSRELYQMYVDYYAHTVGYQDICFVSGIMENCTEKHPSKIRNAADKAKIISGADKDGFTFRGRFNTKEEAVAVSYITTQKAHNALRWLIQKQGYVRDGNTIVAWKIPGGNHVRDMQELEVPDLFGDTKDAFGENVPEYPDTGEAYAKALKEAVKGYRADFSADDKVIMISLDAATPGRISINYYHEFSGNDFIEKVADWHQSCTWERFVKLKDADKYALMDIAPSPREMILAAYGIDRKKGYLECDEELLKMNLRRILPCIIGDAQYIPQDIVRAAVNRTSNPQSFSPFIWENKVFAVTCAMIRYNKRKRGENMDMTPEQERSFLFGKLLAIIEETEQRAMYFTGRAEENRLPNAKKYWSSYKNKPKTWYERLNTRMIQAYSRRLPKQTKEYFENESMRIIERLSEISGFDNRPLKEEYLLGYAEQRKIMHTSRNSEKAED